MPNLMLHIPCQPRLCQQKETGHTFGIAEPRMACFLHPVRAGPDRCRTRAEAGDVLLLAKKAAPFLSSNRARGRKQLLLNTRSCPGAPSLAAGPCPHPRTPRGPPEPDGDGDCAVKTCSMLTPEGVCYIHQRKERHLIVREATNLPTMPGFAEDRHDGSGRMQSPVAFRRMTHSPGGTAFSGIGMPSGKTTRRQLPRPAISSALSGEKNIADQLVDELGSQKIRRHVLGNRAKFHKISGHNFLRFGHAPHYS